MTRERSASAWENLYDPERIARAQRIAEEKFGNLGSEQILYLRKRAKNDLFFLCNGILKYKLLSTNLHGDLCRWLKDTQDERYRLELLPRGHYKSTLITIGESVQISLPHDGSVTAWPYVLGPDVKLLLGHEVADSSSRFLFEIASAFVSNPVMMALFPECVPSKKQRMNKRELELPRETNHKEPTFDTIGAGGASQGRHYNWLKLDDLVGEEARDSETVMKRVLDWFDNVNSLLTRLSVDGFDLTGTRWSYTDVYSHAIQKYGVKKAKSVLNAYDQAEIDKFKDGNLVAYVRGAIEHGKPIFPEEFTLEDLELIRLNPRVWAAQYANNPREAGMTSFDPAWLRYYKFSNSDQIIVGSYESGWTRNVWGLDKVLMVDPSMGEDPRSDESGLMVTGTDQDMNIFVLEVVKERLKPPELVDKIFELQAKWDLRLVSIEEVAFSAIYRYWIEEKARESLVQPRIHQYKPGSKRKKEARILGLTHYFSAGQVYVLAGQHQFLDEYEAFPMGNSFHVLDAMGQGPEVWSEGFSLDLLRDYSEAEEAILADRDALTGY